MRPQAASWSGLASPWEGGGPRMRAWAKDGLTQGGAAVFRRRRRGSLATPILTLYQFADAILRWLRIDPEPLLTKLSRC